MIYIHGGWPKTGTTSLQAALARSRDRLAGAGTVFPERWLDGNSHNGLARMLYDDAGLERAIAELTGYLREEGDRDVLFSSESLLFLLREDETRERLLRLLEAATGAAPVTFVWTLRRVDEMIRSLYRHLTVAGTPLRPPAVLAEDFRAELYVRGFLAVEGAVSRVVYVKYDAEGGHNPELLRAFGLAAAEVDAIDCDLQSAPRLNISRPLRLIDDEIGARLHDRMLRASLDSGFESYPRFFAKAMIPAPGHALADG